MKTRFLGLSLLTFVAAPAAALSPCPGSVNEVWTNCVGTFTFPDDGGKYNGVSRDDKGRDAKGIPTFPYGAKYFGEWKNDKAHGQGVVTFPGGATYVGEIRGDLAYGQGTLTVPGGAKYVGQWRDDKKHGQGTLTAPDGAKYVGQWRGGKRHGQGTLTAPNGEQFVGEFRNNKRQGQGVSKAPGGEVFIGEVWDDKVHGLGFIIWPNGRAISCNFVAGKQRQCVGSSINNVAPILKSAFASISSQNRKKIQQNLKEKNYYGSTIDGIWGRNTFVALASFSVLELKTLDFQSNASADRLLAAAIGRSSAQIPETIRPDSNQAYKVTSGTGFFVSSVGHVITNDHVVDGCIELKIRSNGMAYKTIVIARDPQNDLALLKSSGLPTAYFPLSVASPYPLQDIIVAGFPFGDRVSSSLKFTQGIVSAVAGIGNNYSRIQIDAALQPGNSGGPILDEFGNIVAVAVSKLDLKKILDDYGVVPENTNFGIKVSAVRNLMEGNGVDPKRPNEKVLSKVELGHLANDGTVLLICRQAAVQLQQ